MFILGKKVLTSLLFFATLIPAGSVVAQKASCHLMVPGLDSAKLQLRWELLRNEFAPQSPSGHSLGRLRLKNLNKVALPQHGWALYFNSIDALKLGALKHGLVLEQVSGNLFRIVPTSQFKALGPNQTLEIDYQHADLVVKLAKAPAGPYFVFEKNRELGCAVTDYLVEQMHRPEQLDKGISDPIPLVTSEAIFDRNSLIDNVDVANLPPIFPTPVHIEKRTGTLRLSQMPLIISDQTLQGEAAFAKALLQPYFPAGVRGTNSTYLRLEIGAVAGHDSPEAYELSIDEKAGISIRGNQAAGVLRGVASLRDLLPINPNATQGVTLDALFVRDAPRFEYRGFQLDVSRNFHSKETVFNLLDLMARYKLNKFHFHLTDDEGWRLEIAGIPELTEIGARRGHTLLSVPQFLQPAYGSGPDVNNVHGSGYYSRADYIDILKYAAARHIEVIPEIEMPGHARAAVIAMRSRYHRFEKTNLVEARKFLLSDFNDRSLYKSAQQYTDNVIDPGLTSSFAFIEHVVTQVVALHKEAGAPLKTLHVGGDELPEGAWEKSPASVDLMKAEGLRSSVELWNYFYQKVDSILRQHGLTASGWEELGARKAMSRGKPTMIPNPVFTQNDFRLYVWNNVNGAEDFAYRLANAGYKVVLAPVTKLYFDMAHNKNPEEPGVNWGGYVDLDTIFDFIPFDYLKNDGKAMLGKDALTDFGQQNVLGLEALIFTETVRDSARINYMVMPRMLALAERAWAVDPAWALEGDRAKASILHRRDWSTFVNVLGRRVLPKLDTEMPQLAYRIPPPGLKLIDGAVHVNHQLPGMVLRFTKDGSLPHHGSAKVFGPLRDKGAIQVAAFDQNGRRGLVSRIENK